MCLQALNFPDYADVRPFFILSDEDPCFNTNYNLVKNYDYLIYPNDPLGRKKNAGMRHAMQWDWDYLIELGSDDIITDMIWLYYVKPFAEQWPIFGINNIYYYHPKQNKAVFMSGYAQDHDGEPMPFGALRCIRRDVVEQCMPLWRDTWNWSMDGASYYKIKEAGYVANIVQISDDPVLLDIKTTTNLTNWYEIEAMKHKTVDVEWVKEVFGIKRMSSGDVTLIELSEFHGEVIRLSQQISRRDAFNTVNQRFCDCFGQRRYKNYESYKVQISKAYRNGKI